VTRLLEQALAALRVLPADAQDEIARVILRLAGKTVATPAPLSPDERNVIERSKVAAARGEFASDDEVRAVWAKHLAS
jgi:hypothetical protein